MRLVRRFTSGDVKEAPFAGKFGEVGGNGRGAPGVADFGPDPKAFLKQGDRAFAFALSNKHCGMSGAFIGAGRA